MFILKVLAKKGKGAVSEVSKQNLDRWLSNYKTKAGAVDFKRASKDVLFAAAKAIHMIEKHSAEKMSRKKR